MNAFTVVAEYSAKAELQVLVDDPSEALSSALHEIREADANLEPQSACVVDPGDNSGNGMPLLEWFGE